MEIGYTYFYKLGVVKTNGNTMWYGPVSAVVSGIKPFLSISPNPFSTSTIIKFNLPGAQEHKSTGAQADGIGLKIYNISGRLVRNLVTGDLCSGVLMWDGTDDKGKMLASGMYYCKLTQGSLTQTKKILFVK